MSLVIVGSVAFDAIETPRGKTDKIIGGAGTYICFASSYFSYFFVGMILVLKNGFTF